MAMDWDDVLVCYDPVLMLVRAAELRQLATQDTAGSAGYELLAGECERRVRASIVTPALAEDPALVTRFVSRRAAVELRRTMALAARQRRRRISRAQYAMPANQSAGA